MFHIIVDSKSYPLPEPMDLAVGLEKDGVYVLATVRPSSITITFQNLESPGSKVRGVSIRDPKNVAMVREHMLSLIKEVWG